MQKLVIKGQFMGVKPCEIELRRFLLLIGEQASGKSTIAKLIYFFQALPDAVYEDSIRAYSKGEQFDYTRHINRIARRKFLETFGPTTRNEGFDIHYQYGNAAFLRIYQREDRFTYAEFETRMGFTIGGTVKNYLTAPRLDSSADEINARQNLKHELDNLFFRVNNAHTYLIAGRSTTTAFPETFERVIESELEKLLEDEVKEQDFESRQRLGNERLLYQFVQWSKGVRKNFENNGQTFARVSYSLENRSALSAISSLAETVLKGTYHSTPYGEQIQIKGSDLRVPIKDTSSGQQEVLRILQGIFLAIGLRNRKEFLVIEEPEAHLYPLAQKEVINAFAVFLNTIPQGKIIITTHSPYILACVNILLFASFVSGRVNGQSDQIAVPRDYWLKAEDFTAYSLGQHEAYCVDIKNPRTGLIAQNYLDKISEELGTQYHQLYDLLTLPPA